MLLFPGGFCARWSVCSPSCGRGLLQPQGFGLFLPMPLAVPILVPSAVPVSVPLPAASSWGGRRESEL